MLEQAKKLIEQFDLKDHPMVNPDVGTREQLESDGSSAWGFADGLQHGC
jgi:hypothetical protein